MAKKLVLALGGNALQTKGSEATAEAQLEIVKSTCEHIAEIVNSGYEIAIVHGNGPQVGRLVLAFEAAKDIVPPMPFDVCGAMSQGYIGYHIQQALKASLKKRGKDMPVVTLATQVVVDRNDPAFNNPTKPIGPFYTADTAKKINAEKGYAMREDAGRGWRRVVPSPLPVKIVEIDAVKSLRGTSVVITCGGGGIPVIENSDGSLEGVAAVIDKDFAAELLAEQIDADILLILTEVEKVAINFGKENQENLSHMTVEQAEQYIEEGHFAAGSMLPKVRAAIKFVQGNPDKKAIITSLDKARAALNGEAGTVVAFA